jgi:hypothetical protein
MTFHERDGWSQYALRSCRVWATETAMTVLDARVLGGTFGLVLVAIGLVLATNYRGFTRWHARKSIELMEPLEQVPPWRWLSPRPLDGRVTTLMRQAKVTGYIFTAAGTLVVVVACFAPLTKGR